MYFWDLDGLTEHLSLEKSTEIESFYYLFAAGCLSGVPLDQFIFMTTEHSSSHQSFLMTILGYVIGSAIGFLLLRALFRANGANRGKHFLIRTTALSWVIGLRFLAAYIPVALTYRLIPSSIHQETGGIIHLMFAALSLGMVVFAFFVELASLRKIHQACDLKTSTDID